MKENCSFSSENEEWGNRRQTQSASIHYWILLRFNCQKQLDHRVWMSQSNCQLLLQCNIQQCVNAVLLTLQEWEHLQKGLPFCLVCEHFWNFENGYWVPLQNGGYGSRPNYKMLGGSNLCNLLWRCNINGKKGNPFLFSFF